MRVLMFVRACCISDYSQSIFSDKAGRRRLHVLVHRDLPLDGRAGTLHDCVCMRVYACTRVCLQVYVCMRECICV